MNKPEFELEMKRLVNEYDPQARYYGQARIDAIYFAFQKGSRRFFAAVVDAAFRSERNPPLAKDLLRIAEEIRVQQHQETKSLALVNRHSDANIPPEQVKEYTAQIFELLKGGKRG